MNKDPTGAAILSLISLNIKAKTPLDQVGNLLQEILQGHLAYSQALESDTANSVQELNDAISNDESNIQIRQDFIANLQDDLANAQDALQRTQEDLAANQQALQTAQQDIEDSNADAAVQIPAYDQDIQDLNNAISAVNEATAKMQAYRQSSEGSASFIQMGTTVKDKLKKVTDTVQGMKKKLAKHSNMFTPLIRELIDLGANINQSKADKVIDLLGQLLQALQDALNDTENARASYVDAYQNRQAADADAVQNAQNNIAADEQTIGGLNDRIDQDQTSLQTIQEILGLFQTKLASDQAELEAVQNDYATRKAKK